MHAFSFHIFEQIRKVSGLQFQEENMEINAPPTLKSSNHWVLRIGKNPVNKQENSEGWEDPAFWMPFDEALKTLRSAPDKFSGLGYIVQRDSARGDNQIIGGNLDNCRDPVTGWVSPWAESVLRTINACTSVSISGCGFRFFCLGKLPEGLNKVVGHGPEDLSNDAIINIIKKKPENKDRLAKGEPIWNALEIYESGPRYLAITGEWLPGYPEDLPNRTSQIRGVIAPFLNKEITEPEPQKTANKTEPSTGRDDKLPFLSIVQVIDTSDFADEGDELVGPHPIFGSSTGSNLKVNLSKNEWHYVHAESEASGDSWMWLACECGAIAWEDCRPGALGDASILAQVKQYALDKGYFKEDELFPERSALQNALQLISEIKEKALLDPGLPFEQQYVDALAIIMMHDQPEFERIKAHWKGKVSWRELSNRIKEASIKIAESKESVQEESDSEYISWKGDKPTLSVGPLLEDILADLNVCVVAGTEKELAIYSAKNGTYDIGGSAMRLILREIIERIKWDGDLKLDCLTPQKISKIRSLAPALAKEVGNEFETMVSLICVGNGVVDLKTSQLKDWSPDYYMVQHTPVNYIPDKDWRELAPRFNEALTRTFEVDNDRMEYFQRYMGYCATAETIEDAILIMFGIGGVGKSTLLDIVRKALGDGYARVIKADLQRKAGANSARDGIARARYARMLIMKELEKDNKLSWGTLKELASNSSSMEVRRFYGGTENIHLLSKLVIDTNFLPKADEPDQSIIRRIKLLRFRHIMTPEEKDPRIFNHIVDNELPGVLAWIVEGARKWYESGLGNPAFIEEELSAYKTIMDTHLAISWLEQSGYTVVHNKAQLLPEKWVHTTALYADYQRYADEGGVKPYGIQEFSTFLETRGARKDQKSRTIGGKKERTMFWLNIDYTPAAVLG